MSTLRIDSGVVQLVRSLRDPAVVLEVDGTTIVFANDPFAAALGHPADVLDGCDWTTFIHSDKAEIWMSSIRRALHEGREVRFVGPWRGRSCEHRVAVIHDGGKIAHVVLVIGDDGPEWTHTLESLERRELQLRAAQRIAHLGHYTLAIGTGELSWSDELFHIAGRDRATFVPTIPAFLGMVHAFDRERVGDSLAPALLQLCVPGPEGRASLQRIEYRIVRPDGSVRWLRGESELRFDASGEPAFLMGIVHDLTEVRQAEEARAATHERYHVLVESSPWGVYEIDREGCILSMNDAGLRMLESREDAVCGRPYLDLVGERDRERVAERLEAAFAGEFSEFEFESRNGRRTRSTLTPLRNTQGRLERLMGTTVDVTERTRVEAALQRSELLLNEAQHIAKIGSWELDVAQDRLTMSNELLRMFELDEPASMATARVFFGAIHPEDRDAVRRAYEGSLDTRAPYEIVYRLRMADGRIKWAQLRCETFFDREGKPLRSVGTVQDISELVRAEDALRRDEARFHSIVESFPSGVLLVDADGVIVLANRKLLLQFGYAPSELIGQPIETLVSEPFRTHHVEKRRAYQRAPNSRPMAAGRMLYGQRKDGSTFPVEIGLQAIEMPDGTMTLATVIDITERTRNEQQIRDSLREKETLLREVHHRVKNNLQVVCSLLSLQRGAMRDPSARAVLVDCEERVRIIAMIHEQLYQSSDLGAIELGAHARAIVAKMAQAHAGVAGLSIECDDDLAVPLDSAVPIGFVLHELISNALKHALPAGARTVAVTLRRSGHDLVLTVRDDGAGVPPDWKARASGTLGLSLVLALARQLDGRFELRNEGGAVATLTAPLPAHGGGSHDHE